MMFKVFLVMNDLLQSKLYTVLRNLETLSLRTRKLKVSYQDSTIVMEQICLSQLVERQYQKLQRHY